MKYLHFTRSLMLMALAARWSRFPRPPPNASPGATRSSSFRHAARSGWGRIKPLDTFAQFTMLQLNGKRSFEAPSGERLGPVPWLLDALFYPEIARDYKHFVVDDSGWCPRLAWRSTTEARPHAFSELEPGVES